MKRIFLIVICIVIMGIVGCKNEKEEKEKQQIIINSGGRSDQIKDFKFK